MLPPPYRWEHLVGGGIFSGCEGDHNLRGLKIYVSGWVGAFCDETKSQSRIALKIPMTAEGMHASHAIWEAENPGVIICIHRGPRMIDIGCWDKSPIDFKLEGKPAD